MRNLSWTCQTGPNTQVSQLPEERQEADLSSEDEAMVWVDDCSRFSGWGHERNQICFRKGRQVDVCLTTDGTNKIEQSVHRFRIVDVVYNTERRMRRPLRS